MSWRGGHWSSTSRRGWTWWNTLRTLRSLCSSWYVCLLCDGPDTLEYTCMMKHMAVAVGKNYAMLLFSLFFLLVPFSHTHTHIYNGGLGCLLGPPSHDITPGTHRAPSLMTGAAPETAVFSAGSTACCAQRQTVPWAPLHVALADLKTPSRYQLLVPTAPHTLTLLPVLCHYFFCYNFACIVVGQRHSIYAASSLSYTLQ